MSWPRDRSSPSALARSASRDSTAQTATPSLTGRSAVTWLITSGIGRAVTRRSASARARRATNASGASS